MNFADDTTAAGLIRNNDERNYRDQVAKLVDWCSENNLELNVSKTKEMIIDFRTSSKSPVLPLFINGSQDEIVDKFKFLGITISNDLKWETHLIKCLKKAQQRLFFLRTLKSFRLGSAVLVKFYRAVVDSVLTLSITVWYGAATAGDKRKLDRVVRTASRITGVDLPSVASIYESRVKRKAMSIIKDTSHPANHKFQLLRSGKRYRSMAASSERHTSSFYPAAIRTLNKSLVKV